MKTKELIKAMEIFHKKYSDLLEDGNPTACMMALGYLECFEVFARSLNDDELLESITELQVLISLAGIGGMFKC